MWWQQSVTKLKGIGKIKAQLLGELGIFTIGQLLEYYPRQNAYLDHSKLKTIGELATDGSSQIFKAVVYRYRDGRSARGRSYAEVTVQDKTGFAQLYFFSGQRYTAKKLQVGQELLITGRVKQGRTAKQVVELNVQPLGEDSEAPGIMPVYSLIEGLTQNNLRSWIGEALALAEDGLPESLPEEIVAQCKLPDRLTAIKHIHFPPSWRALAAAKERFIFEELFLLQCGLLYYHRDDAEAVGYCHQEDGALVDQVLQGLPFKLTAAQTKAWQEIKADMESSKPMHRILQGDVGSGKTALAALALAKAVASGYQCCMMAPTEILARQHLQTLEAYLQPYNIKVALLTGGMRAKARRNLLLELEMGLIDVLVGTHALLEEDVAFNNLSLAITDEQHRFGVEQRARLANKSNQAPDILVMTATPIPRTLALTVYGDLDISQMQGRPPGRKPVKTLPYTDLKRQAVYEGLVRQVEAGRQAYVVCPLVESSDQVQARSAQAVYEELKEGLLKDIPCGLLHGRLKPKEKEALMTAFVSGELKVLIATTVIEVGVNVPNASLMIIENAERFGLAQLHQLRGRVGRGEYQSYCVLLAGNDNPESLERLQYLCESEDGFYLAEKDLQLRGAGQLFGLRQHGLPDLRIADIIKDTETIAKARRLAKEFLARPGREDILRDLVAKQFGERFSMIFNI